MQSQIFRNKSVERISSPEQLQDYMRVTTPGVWMVLTAVILLLAGMIISSAVVTMESTIKEQAVVDEDGTVLQIALPLAQKELVEPGMRVRVAGRDAKIDMIFQLEGEVQVLAELTKEGDKLSAGTYDVEIVTETVTPISLLFNRAGDH
jgi:Na+-transporting NADH:ubiquinone oxidoreductase subunit NqrC